VAQLAQQVVGGQAGHPPVALGAGDLPGARVQPHQLGVVVEHLLEVRHQPALVGRIAVEAAAELIEDAARRHPVQRELHHLQRPAPAAQMAAEQEVECHRLRELGRSPEPTPVGVEGTTDALERLPQHAVVEATGRRLERAGLQRQVLGHLPALRARPVALVAPGAGDCQQHLLEGGHAEPVLPGEVGAGEERLPLGGEEHRHRPAALAGHGLHRRHVDGVQVGALLTVDLDAHEVLVHERRGAGVLEGLVGHHVAPVTGSVADRQQDRPVLAARQLQRLRTPRVPVHRVARVLQEVGAGLAGEAVRRRPLGWLCHVGPPTSGGTVSSHGTPAPRWPAAGQPPRLASGGGDVGRCTLPPPA
jgi:hypothetical protein